MRDKKLPPGWVEISQNSLGDFINGYAFKPAHWGKVGKPIIRIQNLTNSEKEFNYTTAKVPEKYQVTKGDVLISWSATLDTFKWGGPDGLLNQHIFKFIPNPNVDVVYAFYLLKNSIAELLKSEHLHGTTMKHINRRPFLEHAVRLAPLPEQRRIGDKIETLFSDLDKGEEYLRQVQTLLKRYRQSVLKAAVTGELTKDWREANKHRLESGEDLLQRILKSRREKWQGRGKYQEAEEPKGRYFSEIPKTWAAATIDQISSAVDYGSSAKCSSYDSGVAVLRMGNIQNGDLDLEDLKYLPHKHDEFPKLLLDEGDLLFNRTNSAELVGKTAIYKGKPKKCSFASYLIRVKLIEVEPEYISAFINSAFGRAWIKAVVSQQVGQANVNGSKLKSLAIPLPPRDEQKEIVGRVSQIFAQIDAFEALCEAELKRSATLRQSILKAAFSGQLVPQDPADESATALLERIAAGTSKKQGTTTPIRKRKTA